MCSDTKKTGIYKVLLQRIHQQVAGKKTMSQATCEKMYEDRSPYFTYLPGVSTAEQIQCRFIRCHVFVMVSPYYSLARSEDDVQR